jgi:hypothetical protein
MSIDKVVASKMVGWLPATTHIDSESRLVLEIVRIAVEIMCTFMKKTVRLSPKTAKPCAIRQRPKNRRLLPSSSFFIIV